VQGRERITSGEALEVNDAGDNSDGTEAPVFARQRQPGRGACQIILVLALGGLALGRLASVWVALDIFNHFMWHLGIVAAAAAIACLLPGWRLVAAAVLAITGFLAISAWALTAGRDPGPVAAAAAGERALEVMSFNSWLGNKDWRAVAAEIERQDPDVVIMVEFGSEQADLLSRLAVAYPFQLECLEVHYCHMAILSKHAFSKSEARTRWEGAPYIRAQLGPAFGNLTLFGIHTTRPPYFRSQLKQIDAIAEVIAAVDGPRLAAGDFNATPSSVMLARFAAVTGLERLTNIPSWPARIGPFPQLAIDHVFVSSGLRALQRPVIGDNAGSDHYPVIALIAVRPAPAP
jgi:endonuclease/exonuclease/phosphatase (EEP) superfamily protein YafD